MHADYTTLSDSRQIWYEGMAVAIDSVLGIDDLSSLTEKHIASYRNGQLRTSGRVVDIELPLPQFAGEPLELVVGPYCLDAPNGILLACASGKDQPTAALRDAVSGHLLGHLGLWGWEAADNPQQLAAARILIRQPGCWQSWETKIISLTLPPLGPRSRLSPLAARVYA